jgi:hypothetical protein
MATFVDGTQSQPYLSAKVHENADIYFTPAIAGGCALFTEGKSPNKIIV